ncbi:PH domain-containing protein, partial [Pantoea septica]|uniref:PH domain-containing protein n=1 Tax=Pantoea septica TaxID=472695 RepID=UPI0028D0CDE5
HRALSEHKTLSVSWSHYRTTVELRLDKVESIGVNQGIMGRLLGYGNIVVKGTGGTGTPIPSIKKPLDFRRVVNNYIEEKDTVQAPA